MLQRVYCICRKQKIMDYGVNFLLRFYFVKRHTSYSEGSTIPVMETLSSIVPGTRVESGRAGTMQGKHGFR